MSDKLPQEIISHWPEVFQDIEIKAVPIEYLSSITVYFDNDEIWEISVKDDLSSDQVSTEEAIEAFFEEYDEAITKVDFKIDSENLINDIKSKTRSFMKKRK